MKKFSIISTVLVATIFLATGCSTYNVDKDLSPDDIAQYELKISEGTETLNRADVSKEDQIKALEEIGIAYERLGEYDQAIDTYVNILEDFDATNFVALNNLSLIYEEVGELELAGAHVAVLHKYYKDRQAVVRNTIRILVKNKDFDSAQLVINEYATNFNTPGNAAFSSEQFEYIQRMKEAEVKN